MIFFIIFLLVNYWSLVTWSLSHFMINLNGRAHKNYVKSHYNHHRVPLVTCSLVTWSLCHLENFSF
jgi:hypothetical protein